MTTWLIRRLIQALFVVLVDVGDRVHRRARDRQPGGYPDFARGRPGGTRAHHRGTRARSAAVEAVLLFVNDALHGNLGRSFVFNEPALRLIAQRMPATMELAVTAVLMSVIFGIPLGLYAGLYPEGAVSRTIMAGSILGFSLPTFWVGLMLIMVFAVQLGWLPSTGRGDDSGAVRRAVVVPDDGWIAPPAAAGAQPVAVQHLAGVAPDARRGARDAADGFRQVRPRQGTDAGTGDLRACAEEHHDPGDHRDRAGARFHRSPSPW